jgi:uncharacterized damage-inducible protein DinB
MSRTERYRELYEYEKDCNNKMLTMIESVPPANRGDARFQQAVTLAAHLAFCREYWLHLMHGGEKTGGEWFEPAANLPMLRPRFADIEARWTEYLAGLDDAGLSREFELAFGEYRMDWYVEGQILQLLGHAPYHRGQVALLVDQLGGETVDTDYLMYARPLKF